jgi:indoleamine 2,3-dioxygenase
MKLCMPAPHRAFLDHLAKVANIRPFVLEIVSAHASPIVQDVTCVYNSYVHQIKLFRDNHIQIVTRYTMTQAKQGLPQGSEDNRVQVEVNKEDEKQKAEELMKEKTQIRGIPKVDVGEPVIKRTGGSDLMLFLKHNRDEMNAAKVQSAVK